MIFKYNDGGRGVAGYKGETRDCVTRAISIVTGRSYQEVYDAINSLGDKERLGRRQRHKSNSRTGVYRKTVKEYLLGLGMQWHPTMFPGSGCQVHLKAEELPKGKLIARVSKHYCAVIDGVINDTFDPSRNGTRCVYGYYTRI